jgi:hypothetical protein
MLLRVSAAWQSTCDNTRKIQSHAACEAHVRVPSEPDAESRTPLFRVADALRGWTLARTTHIDCKTEIWHSRVIVARFVPKASQSSRDYALVLANYAGIPRNRYAGEEYGTGIVVDGRGISAEKPPAALSHISTHRHEVPRIRSLQHHMPRYQPHATPRHSLNKHLE